MVLGKVFIDSQNKIIALPTKKHWKSKSKLIDIKNGLKDLHKQLMIKKIKKIVMPQIGSGLGGLDFNKQVLPLIKEEFANSKIEKVVISLWNTTK